MIDGFIAALEARAEDDRRARAAAIALGHAGDARGVAALIDAFASSWRSQVVAEALGHAAGVALIPLIERIEAQPQLAARKASAETVANLPGEDVAGHLVARLDAASADDVPRLADVYLDVTRPNPAAHRAVAAAVLARVPESSDKAIRALRRAASRAVAAPSPS
jgi:hypothetical protein